VGRRPTKDGVDACSSSVVNFSNNPVEIIESEYPLMIERYGYLPDTGGPGKFRAASPWSASIDFSRPRAPSSSAPTVAITCPTASPAEGRARLRGMF
jgi:N-methylhydantoinase B/oxoprolinase/acetone carboxylase alpha subunit